MSRLLLYTSRYMGFGNGGWLKCVYVGPISIDEDRHGYLDCVLVLWKGHKASSLEGCVGVVAVVGVALSEAFSKILISFLCVLVFLQHATHLYFSVFVCVCVCVFARPRNRSTCVLAHASTSTLTEK